MSATEQTYVNDVENGFAWTFDDQRSDGGILVNAIQGDMPEYKPGATFDVALEFWEIPNYSPHDAGGTLGAATGFTLGGATGATAGSGNMANDHIYRYKQVREYTRYAGRYAKNSALSGDVHVLERTPSSATVDSILVPITPGPALEHTPGIWVAIDDADDQTRFIEDMARLSLSVTFLAKRSEYDTRTDLKNALGSDL